MEYAAAMERGASALADGDLVAAYGAFQAAHDLGHEVRRDHFAAHRGMIRTALRQRRLDRVIANLVLLAAAFVFDWPRHAAASPSA